MEEKKVKVTVECTDGEIRVFEGKAILGFIFESGVQEDGSPIDEAIFTGIGDQLEQLTRAATSLGEMVRQAVKSEFSQALISGVMAKKLIRAAAGDSEEYKTVVINNEVSEVEEEKA